MSAALSFRVVVPGVARYEGIFLDQQAAAADAARRYPDAPPAWTFCLSRGAR